jgi:hypothetical protein
MRGSQSVKAEATDIRAWNASNVVWISGDGVLRKVRNEFTTGSQQTRARANSMGLFCLLIFPFVGLEASGVPHY